MGPREAWGHEIVLCGFPCRTTLLTCVSHAAPPAHRLLCSQLVSNTSYSAGGAPRPAAAPARFHNPTRAAPSCSPGPRKSARRPVGFRRQSTCGQGQRLLGRRSLAISFLPARSTNAPTLVVAGLSMRSPTTHGTGMRRLRSTASPRVGPLVLVLLSTLVGKVGALDLCRQQSAYCGTCSENVEPGGERYEKTTKAIGGCSCLGLSFPVYRRCDKYSSYSNTQQCYNKYLYFSCNTGKWGTTTLSYTPTCTGGNLCYMPAHTTDLDWTLDKLCPQLGGLGGRNTCGSYGSPPSPPTTTGNWPPNDNSCASYNIADGVCDDTTYGMCDCGTDFTDCPYRSSNADCATNSDNSTDGDGDGKSTSSGNSTSSGERSKGLQALMYVLTGILGLFGLTLLVLLVVSCFTKKAEPQPTRAVGTPNVDGAAEAGDRLASSSQNRGSMSGGVTSRCSSSRPSSSRQL